jgi:hypothetical protein
MQPASGPNIRRRDNPGALNPLGFPVESDRGESLLVLKFRAFFPQRCHRRLNARAFFRALIFNLAKVVPITESESFCI